MQEQVLPDCTTTIEPQVVDLAEPSVDTGDPAMLPDLIAPCISVPVD